MSNKIIKSILLLSVAAFMASCDFEEINTNPNNSTFIEPGPLLTYTQLNTTGGGSTKNMQIGTCMMLVQQTATLNTSEASAGDKYYMMQVPSTTYFDEYYKEAIKNWRELEIQAAKDTKYQNMSGVAKIWGAYLFQRITDLYGNVPYSEAGLGFHQMLHKPKYDSQEEIYTDMIAQVKAGLSLLSADKPAIEGDLFYNGNLDKWKKFGNSLLLRIGMRLCKVNPTLAASTAKEAINGGIMNSAEDICMVKHIAGGRDYDKNPLSLRFQKDNYIGNDIVKISSTFMNYLKATNDPRISVYCSLKNGDNTPSKQLGLPNGHDLSTITSVPGYIGKESCSNFNTNTILKMDAPTLFMMPSEGKLLQAEAVLRGWVSGDADALFKEAVRLSMNEQKAAYGIAIPESDIEAYLAQNLMGKATGIEGKMAVLGEQYWIVTFMNGYESFANWRRCGYPKLTPTNYKSSESNGQIPRRLPYSIDEYTINKANVEAANKQQGEDKVTTRVWWDK